MQLAKLVRRDLRGRRAQVELLGPREVLVQLEQLDFPEYPEHPVSQGLRDSKDRLEGRGQSVQLVQAGLREHPGLQDRRDLREILVLLVELVQQDQLAAKGLRVKRVHPDRLEVLEPQVVQDLQEIPEPPAEPDYLEARAVLERAVLLAELVLQGRVVVLVLREVPVILELQDPVVLGVEPDRLVQLEPQEIQVTMDYLDQTVPLVRPEIRDRPDLLVQLAQSAGPVQQGLPVCLEPLVLLVLPDQRDLLGILEYLVIPVQVDFLASEVRPVKSVLLVVGATPEPPVPPVHLDSLVLEEELEEVDLPGPLVQRDRRDGLVRAALLAGQEHREPQDLLDPKDGLVQPGRSEPPDPRVWSVQLEELDFLVGPGLLDRLAFLEVRVPPVLLVTPDRLDSRDLLELQVQRDSLDCSVPPVRLDQRAPPV